MSGDRYLITDKAGFYLPFAVNKLDYSLKLNITSYMKYSYFLILFISVNVKAQILNFDKRFGESENKWVAIRTKDSTFDFGFVYVDPTAGFTLNYEGRFSILKDGTFVPYRRDTLSSMKIRLQPNQTRVAIIPESKFTELKLIAEPGWLKYYRNDTVSAQGLYSRGFNFNGLNECAKGLAYLEQAKKLDPKLKRLDVELAFSYNCLKQYEKAIKLLEGAIQTNPGDCYFYKELVYAQINSSQLSNAIATAKKASTTCDDPSMNGEISYNIAHQFYLKKDKVNFEYWASEVKKLAPKNNQLINNVKAMEMQMEK